MPTMPPFPGVPSLAVGAGRAFKSPLQGGCGSVYYLAQVVAEDQCGPFVFDAVLALQPISAQRQQAMTITAPPTYGCSAADAGLAEGWAVGVADAGALRGVVDATAAGMPRRLATVRATGLGPVQKVSVRAPSRVGEYVLELACPMDHNGWTFVGGFYYWLIRVR
jgi:hypothetical protein